MDENATQVDDPWVIRLKDPDHREDALTELRAILLRGVVQAFPGVRGGESFCEDVVQDSLLRILDKLDLFSGKSRFTTWAMSVAVRVGTSQLRKRQFKDVSLDALSASEDLQFDVPEESAVTAAESVDHAALLGHLRNLIATSLTEKQRKATNAILHGMPVEEIARRTDSNRNAVYKLIHDARMRLKQGLESLGYSSDDILTMSA